MSESKHTPEPWTVNPYLAQIAADDLDVPVCAMLWPTDLRSEDETFANARRIVACVNACAGLGTEALEAGVVGEMVKELGWIIYAIDAWCFAISEDSSWDGWDYHYKQFAYNGGLDKARSLVAKIGGAS